MSSSSTFVTRKKRPLYCQDIGSGIVNVKVKHDNGILPTIPNGTLTDIIFTTDGSLQSDNKTWIAPINGMFRIEADIEFVANGTGLREVRVTRNNGVIARDIRVPSASGACSMKAATVIYLKVGDQIKMSVSQNSGGTLAMAQDSGNDEFTPRMTITPVSTAVIVGV